MKFKLFTPLIRYEFRALFVIVSRRPGYGYAFQTMNNNKT